MGIPDRYFVELVTRPALFFNTDFSFYGYFETKQELATFLSTLSKRMVGISDLHIRIFEAKEERQIEDLHFSMSGKKGSAVEIEPIDFTNNDDTLLFINKYFDISDAKVTHDHYEMEIILQRKSHKDSVILGVFSSINEFVKILSSLSKKVKEEGVINFVIERKGVRICAKSYKMFEDGSILAVELSPHYINLKNTQDLQRYSLYLWENEFENNKISKSQYL